jgi:hypothetical protein
VPIPAEVFLEDERGVISLNTLTSSFRKRVFVVKWLEVQRPLANLDKVGGL